jgi:hypothetical protein
MIKLKDTENIQLYPHLKHFINLTLQFIVTLHSFTTAPLLFDNNTPTATFRFSSA